MSALAIIQARMGSTRFPGKVLEPIGGKAILLHIVERLSAEFTKAMRTPRLQALASENSMEVIGFTPAEFTAYLKEDRANAARIFKALGIRPLVAPPN